MKTDSTAKPDSTGALALYNQATNVAGLCKELAVKKALSIAGRRFLPVEVWTTIAVAHGCMASIERDSVKEIFRDGKLLGIRAIGILKRISDGAVLSEAEGFVGADEVDWYGSDGKPITRWSKKQDKEIQVIVEKRDDYAIRAMAQTRAVSRVCRTGFSHVVVMIDENLSTTPFEEVSNGDVFDLDDRERKHEGPPDAPKPAATEEKKNSPEVPRDEAYLQERKQFEDGKWKSVVIHFGKNGPNGEIAIAKKKPKGLALGDLETSSLKWYVDEWQPKPFGRKPISEDDRLLRAALDVAEVEAFK